MQARINDQIRRAYRAYATGDMTAGEIVDQDVREHMRQTGANYSTVLHARLTEFKRPTVEPRPKPTAAQRRAAGDEIDQVAKDLMRWKRIGYSQAVREALLANPILAETYGDRPVTRDGFERV